MKTKKPVKLDLRDPKRRVSTAWVRNYVKQYHDTYVAPLHARVVLLETLLAELCEGTEAGVRLKLEARVAALEGVVVP